MSADESRFASLASYDQSLLKLKIRQAKLVVQEMVANARELNAMRSRDTIADSDGDDGS